jgi:hypothetical protein
MNEDRERKKFDEYVEHYGRQPQEVIAQLIRRTTMTPPEVAIFIMTLLRYRHQLLRHLSLTDAAIAGSPKTYKHLLQGINIPGDRDDADVAEAARMIIYTLNAEPLVNCDVSNAPNFMVQIIDGTEVVEDRRKYNLRDAFARLSILAFENKQAGIFMDGFMLYRTQQGMSVVQDDNQPE